MKSFIQTIFFLCIYFLTALPTLIGQVQIENYSDKNHVSTICITHDTAWIGSDGGIVVRRIDSQLLFTLTVNDSLSSNYITAIAVDSVGNKWFGTFDNGLIRYNNGVKEIFSSFTGFPFDKINCIEADANGNVWIGTNSGIVRCYWALNKFQFETLNSPTTIIGLVKSICVDGSTIWFGTDVNGLYKFDGTWKNYATSDGLPSNRINDLALKADTLFIATDSGLSYTLKTGVSFSIYINLIDNKCLSVEVDPVKGTKWVGTESLLFSISGATAFPFTQFIMNSYPVLEFDRTGKLWAGFTNQGQGIKTYDGSFPQNYQVSDSFSPPLNNFSSILAFNGEMYFGTHGSGIVKFDGVAWSNFYTSEPDINCLGFKRDTLYIGTPTGYTQYVSGSFYPHSTGAPVNSIQVDKKGKIWVGTDNGVFSIVNNLENPLSTANLLNQVVKKIVVDSANQVWFMHPNGLTMYNGLSFVNFTPAQLSVTAAVNLNDIATDTLGNLWIACNEGIIYRIGNAFGRYLASAGGLAQDKVLSVNVDRNNIKYFGTANNGLSLFNNGSWRNIGRNVSRLATNNLVDIQLQNLTNKTWMVGNYGGVSSLSIYPLYVSIFTVSGTARICEGHNISLDRYFYGGVAPGNLTYTWTSNNGSFTSTNQSVTVNPVIATVYYLKATDGFMYASDSILIEPVPFNPSKINGPSQVCSGNLINNYFVSSDPMRTYSWNVQGGTITKDAQSSDIEVILDAAAPGWELKLDEVQSDLGCTVSQQFPVMIEQLSPPDIVRKGENLLICTDSGMTNYEWYLDGNLLQAPNRQFYYLDRTRSDIYGIYSVSIQSKLGCDAKSPGIMVDNKLIKVFPIPAKELVNIEFLLEQNEPLIMEIMDLEGVICQSLNIEGIDGINKATIVTNRYKAGIYNYRIRNGGDIIAKGKFIIN